jgi:hypothetical protein
MVNIYAQNSSISNNRFTINFNIDNGTWSANTIDDEKIVSNAEFLFITEEGEKYYSSSKSYKISIRQASIRNEMGNGQMLQANFTSEDENIPDVSVLLTIYENQSYFSLEVKLQNKGSESVTIREIQPIRLDPEKDGYLHFGCAPEQISCLIDGYSPGNESKILFLRDQSGFSGHGTTAFYDQQSKKSLIIGFLENTKSINLIAGHTVNTKTDDHALLEFTTSSYFSYYSLGSNQSVSTGKILIDIPDNVFDGLECYADLIAKINKINLNMIPLSGWCSWYYEYPDITEKEVLKNLNFLADNLRDYGLKYIQVDRGRIPTGTDWLSTNSKFPNGMKWMADQIHEKGFKAGIWTAPYWLGRESTSYNEDWILYKISTEPKQEGKRRRHWASWGDVLDTSNDEVISYMKNFVDVLINDWGYDYLKNDFLQYGLPEIKTLNTILLENGEIEGVEKYQRKNKSITPVEAFRNGTIAIQEAAGDETFIMGCGAPLFHTAGTVHSCRVGGDIQSKLCVSWICGTSKTVRTSAKRYYYNGRTMWIDPDCLVVGDPCGRGSFTLDEARSRASMASLFGGMIMTSDRMYELSPEKIDVLKRVLPVYPQSARPLDLFEKDMPEIWLWEINKDFGKWHVLGVFNYTDETLSREISYDYLGLDSNREYLFFDFWKKKMPTRSSRYNYRTLMPFDNEVFLELSPRSCFVIAIREKLDHPQLLSTNRHLTQGAIELEDVKWNEEKKELSGISELVKNDDYELVLTLPKDMEFNKAEVADSDVSCEAFIDDPDVDRFNTVKVKLMSPENKKVRWSVLYK